MSAKPAKGPAQVQRLKIVVRRLPPTLPEAAFWKSVAPWVAREADDSPDAAAERVAAAQFRPGKVRRTGKDKDDVHARAYIQFRTPDALVAFHRGYDGHSFRDKHGVVSQVVIEFAPYQRAAIEAPKKDSRQGTIDTDPDYLAFQEALSAPELDKVDEAPAPDTKASKSTPLLDHLRAQKALETASRPGGKQTLYQGTSKTAASGSAPAKKAAPAKGAGGKNGGAAGGKKAQQSKNGNGNGGASGPKANGKGKGKATPTAPQPPSLGSASFPALGAAPAPAPPPSVQTSQPQQARSAQPPRQQQARKPPAPQPVISLLQRPQPPPSQSTATTMQPLPQSQPQQQQQAPSGARRPPPGKDATAGQRRQLGAALGALGGDGSAKPRGRKHGGGAVTPAEVALAQGSPAQSPRSGSGSRPGTPAGGQRTKGSGGQGGRGPKVGGQAGNGNGQGAQKPIVGQTGIAGSGGWVAPNPGP